VIAVDVLWMLIATFRHQRWMNAQVAKAIAERPGIRQNKRLEGTGRGIIVPYKLRYFAVTIVIGLLLLASILAAGSGARSEGKVSTHGRGTTFPSVTTTRIACCTFPWTTCESTTGP
jgi:hypothetical protein